MTVRVDVLAYWIFTLFTAVASGQNFERLLAPRDYQRQRATREAYQDGARDAVQTTRNYRGDIDYGALKENISREYGAELGGRSFPAHSARRLPPPSVANPANPPRYEQYRVPNEWEPRQLPPQFQDRVGYEQELRRIEDRYENDYLRGLPRHEHPGCQGEECSTDSSNLRPIRNSWTGWGGDNRGRNYADRGWGYDDWDRGHGGTCDVARASYEVPPRRRTPGPASYDYRQYRQTVDRDGNYVSDNLFGDPRVFNPDQPVRNLFRFIFP